jgi:hypothetical protein
LLSHRAETASELLPLPLPLLLLLLLLLLLDQSQRMEEACPLLLLLLLLVSGKQLLQLQGQRHSLLQQQVVVALSSPALRQRLVLWRGQ